MSEASMPERFPATANDLATHVMGSVSQHLELGCHLAFDGRLDPDVLSRAVRLSLDAEPVLGCTLHTGAFRAWWQRVGDLDEHVPFSVLETADLEAESTRFQCTPLDDAGPQVAVRLLRSAATDDVSCVITHDVADGQGAKQYAYLLADLYTRLLADPSFAPSPDLAPRPQASDVWDKLSDEQRRAAKRTPSMTMPSWDVPSTGVSGGGRTFAELRVSPARFRALKDYGRARRTTVNAMLLTAFFRAVAHEFPPVLGKPMSLPFTVDYRRYLQASGDVPIANLALSIWLGVPHVEGEAFDGTLARVAEQLTAWCDATWGAKSLVQAAGIARIGYGPMKAVMGAISGMSAKSAKTSPIFTNIGVLDEGRLSFGGLTPTSARLSGPAAFGASLVPTISTYRDELTVSMGFCADDMDPGVIDSALRFIDEEIEVLVER